MRCAHRRHGAAVGRARRDGALSEVAAARSLEIVVDRIERILEVGTIWKRDCLVESSVKSSGQRYSCTCMRGRRRNISVELGALRHHARQEATIPNPTVTLQAHAVLQLATTQYNNHCDYVFLN